MSAGLMMLIPLVGIVAACAALGIARATYYRRQRPARIAAPRPTPPRALSQDERAAVLATLDSPRFADKAPAEVVQQQRDFASDLENQIRAMEENLKDLQQG